MTVCLIHGPKHGMSMNLPDDYWETHSYLYLPVVRAPSQDVTGQGPVRSAITLARYVPENELLRGFLWFTGEEIPYPGGPSPNLKG